MESCVFTDFKYISQVLAFPNKLLNSLHLFNTTEIIGKEVLSDISSKPLR